MLKSTFTSLSKALFTQFLWLLGLLLAASTVEAQTTTPTALSATLTATPSLLTATTGTTSLSATARGGTAPYSYTFNGPGAISANGSSTATVTGLIPGIHVFTLTVRDTGVPASGTVAAVASQAITTTTSVTVPGGSLVGTSTICAGQSATLSVSVTNATGPFTLVYTSASSSSTGIVSTTLTSYTSGSGIVVSPAATTTYTLISLIGANGVALPVGGAAIVTVVPLPNITVLGSPVLCNSNPVNITATGGTSYALLPLSSPQQTSGIFTLFQPISYTLIAFNGSCSRSLSFSASTGTAIPNASLVASSSVLCAGSSVSLVATAGGTNYSFSGPGVTQTGVGNQVVVNQPGTYQVAISGPNGCISTISTFVTPAQATGTFIPLGQLTCNSSVVSLSATGAAPGTSYVFGGSGVLASNPTGSLTVAAAGSYSVIFTGTNGCRTTLATTVTSNTAAPQAFLFANNNLSCTIPAVTLISPAGSRDYYFSGPRLFQVTSSNSITAVEPGVYSVLLVGDNGCTSIASTTVGFTPNTSVASLNATGNITCAQNSVTLVAGGTGSVFDFKGPGVAQFGSATSITVNQPGMYFLTVTGLPGCSATAVTTVFSLTSPPFISVTQSGSIGCDGGSVTLRNINQGFAFRFTGPGGFSTTNTTGVASVAQAGTYTLVSTNQTTSCSAVALIPVIANCDSRTVAPPPITSAFRMLTPAYNCQTGTITLQTTGGDGSPITFFTPGVARNSPQSNTGTVELGVRLDPKVLVLSATQSGTTVSITFDLAAFCIRARVASAEATGELNVTVLGNPTIAESISVDVRGAEGKPLRYQLRDLTGRLITEKQTETASDVDRQTLRLGSSGMYLLTISSPTQSKTVKVVRQ